jgi:hypothetical protein
MSELDRARPQAGHHVLVVANETLAGAELAELILQHGRDHVEVDVLAPVLASHVHYAVSDIDGEVAEARTPSSARWPGHANTSSWHVGKWATRAPPPPSRTSCGRSAPTR